MNALTRWYIIRKLKQLTKKIEGGEIMKPGFLTTEFWLTLATGIVTAVCQAFKVDPGIQDAILKLVLAYIGSRTAVKIADAVKNREM